MKTFLIGMYGYPGSGKTYFSQRLSEKKGWFHLSSDRIRLKMFDEPEYTQEEHKTVFNFMDYLAAELLRKGMSVVYDANFNFKESREKLARIATETNARYYLVHIETPEETALKRIDTRYKESDNSKKDMYRPITREVFEKLRDEHQELSEDEEVIIIDGMKEFDEQLKSFEAQVNF